MATPNDRRDSLWVLALTSVANLMVALDAMVVSTALTAIGRDLGASIEALQWTVNASGSYVSALAFSHGFASAMGVAAMLSLGGAGAGLLLTRRSRAGVALPAGPPLLSGVDDKA